MDIVPNSLFLSTDFAEYLFNNLDIAIFIVDKERRIRRANDPFRSLFSISDIALLNVLYGDGMKCKFAHLKNGHCGDAEACKSCPIQKSIENALGGEQKTTITYIPWELSIDNEVTTKYLQFTCKPVDFFDTPMVIITVHDITELEDQKQQIRDLANRDFLTGLVNRRFFFEVGESFFFTAKREFINIGIAMFDIDYFKRVNDDLGHAAGDYVIKEIAEIIKGTIRKNDVAARFGGEEFCLLLQCTHPNDAYTVVEKIRTTIAGYSFSYKNIEIRVSMSCGLTIILGNTLEAMINKADDFLYKAKHNGRNRTEGDFFDHDK